MDRAIAELGDLHDQTTTLEIGCGWGGLAIRRLQQQAGRHVGITLSPANGPGRSKRSQTKGSHHAVIFGCRTIEMFTSVLMRLSPLK